MSNVAVGTHMGLPKLDEGLSQIANGESRGWTIDQTSGRLTTPYGLDLGGNSIQNVSAIMSAFGNWRIDQDGKLVVKSIETQKLKVGSPQEPQGITLYDPSGSPYCVKIEAGGAVVSTAGECGKK